MKRLFCVAGLVGVMAGLSFAGGPPLWRSDDFNDGIRNTAFWRIQRSGTGQLVETNGRLFFDSNNTAPYSFTSCAWQFRTAYPLFGGDVLATSALISFPPLVIPSDAQILLGLGWQDGFPVSSKYFHMKIREYSGERQLIVAANGTGLTSRGTIFPLPRAVNRFYLLARYNALTGKATFWQKAVNNAWSYKIGSVDLNGWWNVPLGSAITLAPFVYGAAGQCPVTTGDNLYIDNFQVQYIPPSI
jgi:hypothetical protein